MSFPKHGYDPRMVADVLQAMDGNMETSANGQPTQPAVSVGHMIKQKLKGMRLYSYLCPTIAIAAAFMVVSMLTILTSIITIAYMWANGLIVNHFFTANNIINVLAYITTIIIAILVVIALRRLYMMDDTEKVGLQYHIPMIIMFLFCAFFVLAYLIMTIFFAVFNADDSWTAWRDQVTNTTTITVKNKGVYYITFTVIDAISLLILAIVGLISLIVYGIRMIVERNKRKEELPEKERDIINTDEGAALLGEEASSFYINETSEAHAYALINMDPRDPLYPILIRDVNVQEILSKASMKACRHDLLAERNMSWKLS